MDSKLLITIATAVSLLSSIALISQDASVAQLQSQFAAFKVQHGKSYTAQEEAYRFAVFAENVAWINQFNSEGHTSTVGINLFTDLTKSEFKALYTGFKKPEIETGVYWHAPEGYEVPNSVDWVSKGAVTDVKNQGQCGSCWAFGTVGGIEGAYQLGGKPLTSFSEQQICSCDTQSQGCGGGLPSNAYQYVNQAGLSTYAQYPYTSGDGETGSCEHSSHPVTIPAGQISGTPVGKSSRADFLAALSKEPLTICIDASSSVFSGYTGGVITSGCGTSIDHCVTAVAYDLGASQPYVNIKNSWGTSYGLSGYVKVGISAQTGDGNCALYEYPYLANYSA